MPPVTPAVAVSSRFVTAGGTAGGDAGTFVAASSVPPRDEARRQGRLILVAEDNDINRKVVVEQLRLIGFAAEVTVDGREALERWRSGDFGLVLTDLRMPDMDGYALAAAIRAEEGSGRRTPIVALTANALLGEEARCLAAGMDAYLTKPVKLPVLKATIEAGLAGVPLPNGDEPPSGDETSVATAPPADLKVLAELVGDDPAVIEEMVRFFRDAAVRTRSELARGIAGGSVAEIHSAAHKMKSGARSLGALALGETCAEIDEAAGIDAIKALAARFDSELEAVLRFLDAPRSAA